MPATRIILADLPFRDHPVSFWQRGVWPASWVGNAAQPAGAGVTAYRLRFTCAERMTARIHVSGDERYELFLDGERIGDGPERGDLRHWLYESWDLELPAGEHVLVARTWWLGHVGTPTPAAHAQYSVCPAFLLAAEGAAGPLLSTGVAAWQAGSVAGVTFTGARMTWGTPGRVRIDGAAYPWGFEHGDGPVAWAPVRVVGAAVAAKMSWQAPPAWLLAPARLPAQAHETITGGRIRHIAELGDHPERTAVRATDHLAAEAAAWSRLLSGAGTVTIPARTARRVLIDLEQYHCAYPVLTLSGGAGARAALVWAEALHAEPEGRTKRGRDEVEGLYLIGVGEEFIADGDARRAFSTPWWEAGRYVELQLRTLDQPLTIDAFALRTTGYPLVQESRFAASDPRLAAAVAPMERAMRMCMHETYMDCPYYEQLQYVGDTRLECLVTRAFTRDRRLPRKAIELFDWSRDDSGFTASRYPSSTAQRIPPFSLIWVAMVHDGWMWDPDPASIRERLSGVRTVLDACARSRDADGLVVGLPGWNFMDWVPDWSCGIPPDGDIGTSGVINWLYVHALRLAAELEDALGEPELAALRRRHADQATRALDRRFWNEARGLYADDLAHQRFSEHSQCLALIAGIADEARRGRVASGLMTAADLARATIYFKHYLFEACRLIGRVDHLLAQLPYWFDLAGQGFVTTPEMPEPTRSDCHAWGAHPYFHYFATILGIRPAAPGFARVRIQPQLGGLTSASGTFPHPRGDLVVEVSAHDGALCGSVQLPDGVDGILVLPGTEVVLRSGVTRFGKLSHTGRER